MNEVTCSVNVNAPASVVWAIWSDLAASPEWDTDVASCRLDGAFVSGTNGITKLNNGLTMVIKLEDIVVGKSWSNTARFLGANLRFNHWLEETSPDTCRVIHQADVSQVKLWPCRKILQILIRPALAKALDHLALLAAQKVAEVRSI